MKFLVDESVEYSIVSYLRSLDHDVRAIAEDSPGLVGCTPERLTVLLGTHAEKLSKNFVVVDSKTIRIRPFLHPRV